MTVVLDTQPITNVVVSVLGSDSSEATLSPSTLLFTTSNWDTPQTITVTGVDDQIIDGNKIVYITISIIDELSSDEYDYVPSQSFLAVVYDDDRGSYSVYETNNSTVVSEAGMTDSFSVVLNKKPASKVVFSIVSQDTEEGTVSTSSLTFSPSNWDVPQSVTVTGVNDGLDDGNQKFDIKISVIDSSSDGAFASQADQKLSVTNLDNDGDEEEEEEEDEEEVEEVAPVCVVGFGSVVESSGSTVMSEGGSSDSFTFALASQPGSSVVVSVKSSDLSEASVSTSSLTFSPSNWDVPQSVTVTGVNDGLGDGDQSVNIVLSAEGFEDVLVGATNIDNE